MHLAALAVAGIIGYAGSSRARIRLSAGRRLESPALIFKRGRGREGYRGD